MSVCSIRLYPEPILRVKTKPIGFLTSVHRRIIENLVDTLGIQPGGIGIAAPQIGYSERIAVVDLSRKNKGKKQLILINPEIIMRKGETFGREGCMSVPDFTANIKRASVICLRWRDENFRECDIVTEGLEAICIQHEVDHLDGFLFLDRVSSITKDIFRRKKYL